MYLCVKSIYLEKFIKIITVNLLLDKKSRGREGKHIIQVKKVRNLCKNKPHLKCFVCECDCA